MLIGFVIRLRGYFFVVGCLVLILMLFVCKSFIVSKDEVKFWFSFFFVVSFVGFNKFCGVAVFFKFIFLFVDVVRDLFGCFVRVRLLRAGVIFDVVSLYAFNLRFDCVIFFVCIFFFGFWCFYFFLW